MWLQKIRSVESIHKSCSTQLGTTGNYVFVELDEYHKSVLKLESADQHRKRMEILDKREMNLIHQRNMKNRRQQVTHATFGFNFLSIRLVIITLLPV